MKSFCALNGQEPFNWNAFLNQETFTKEEVEEALVLSESWVTCACGNLCAELPRRADDIPVDVRLQNLGIAFSQTLASANNNFTQPTFFMNKISEARQVLERIEERSIYLLKELRLL